MVGADKTTELWRPPQTKKELLNPQRLAGSLMPVPKTVKNTLMLDCILIATKSRMGMNI